MEKQQLTETQPIKAVVVDVQIPFWSIVALLIKWAVAFIPAFAILFVVSAVLMAMVTVITK